MAAKKAATGSNKPQSTVRKIAAPAVSQSAAPKKTPSKKVAAAPQVPTFDEIALRAFQIWEAKGKPAGQDAINWREAEAQLRTERGL
ncbi:MAG: DUF2934 domain-containing protein [Phycisphaeraceae bacterium]